ncbi:MAG: DUF1684 domain-containing protein [Gemmatimonadetes bacterium]|nr:DUF1684 domain-containing protein [Gemmatimonadota bacterium]
MKKSWIGNTFLWCTPAFLACQPAPEPIDPATHRAEVEAWREGRWADLERPDGWLSLVGLLWLKDGHNTFGADSSNDVVFPPNAASHIGGFDVREGRVTMDVAPGVPVRSDGAVVQSLIMRSEAVTDSVVAQLGSLRWHVIQRQGRFAIRLKDSQSPTLLEFDGIEMFEVNPEWWSVADFERYDPPKMIKVPNILGTVSDQPSPGAVVFRVNGKTFRLDVTTERGNPNYFIAFADSTNGFDTYGGGRFLWVDAEDEHGRTVLDFNRSYNPPCGFTDFATCPLPPRQNRLPLHIDAGEKDYHR